MPREIFPWSLLHLAFARVFLFLSAISYQSLLHGTRTKLALVPSCHQPTPHPWRNQSSHLIPPMENRNDQSS